MSITRSSRSRRESTPLSDGSSTLATTRFQFSAPPTKTACPAKTRGDITRDDAVRDAHEDSSFLENHLSPSIVPNLDVPGQEAGKTIRHSVELIFVTIEMTKSGKEHKLYKPMSQVLVILTKAMYDTLSADEKGGEPIIFLDCHGGAPRFHPFPNCSASDLICVRRPASLYALAGRKDCLRVSYPLIISVVEIKVVATAAVKS
ncbi:hypothetical protein C8Q75DRAFT_803235 [Abortiporus biennis]|nr:hypothetical protein C8Q75DRAFT_803235 [Abortiporus biennis]